MGSKDVNMFAVKEPIPVEALCCAPVTAGVLDEATAAVLAGVLKALADPVRLRLVSLIAAAPAGEVCACDLPALLDRSQPTVSHHLTLLVRAGLVDREQRGKWAWFRIREDGLAAVRAALGGERAVVSG
jgi:ArsR family transcriptional regulator